VKKPRIKPLPHAGVYTRIGRSKVDRDGVGVFAIRKIPKGVRIFPDDTARLRRVRKESLRNLPDELRRLYEDFAVIKPDYYLCPPSFNRLTVSWYLNEPKKGGKPNVRCDNNYDFFAIRDIKPGEELTTVYSTYSDPSRWETDYT
jgi:hypothetical protein